jgi:thioredoxin reductase (NADPH)
MIDDKKPGAAVPPLDVTYDCAIVGGGPAGLSAALYMGRMRRSVIVVDGERGRSTWFQLNNNYLGFPDGIHARNLREIGEEHAARYGARFLDAYATDARYEGQGAARRFYVETSAGTVKARTLILATGVHDEFPQFEGSVECIGRSMFWCIICDGYESIDKRVVVLGSGTRAANLALELLVFTPHVTLVAWEDPLRVPADRLDTMREHGITIYDKSCTEFKCAETGFLCNLGLEDGTDLELDMLFVAQEMQPNNQLAKALDLMIDENGFLVSDSEQCTNVDGVYAAGDITHLFNHQVATAVHEGGMAAAAANYYLYEDWQKE